MKRKVLASLLVIAVVAGLVGAGTWAYFSDTGTSSANTFTAGTLILKLWDANEDWADGVTATWQSPPGWAPGQQVTADIWLKNVGSVDAQVAYADFAKPDCGGGANLFNVIQVTAWKDSLDGFTADFVPAFTSVYDQPTPSKDGKLSLWELINGDSYWAGSTSPWEAVLYNTDPVTGPALLPAGGGSYGMRMTFKFMETAGDEYQGASCTFDLVLKATQEEFPTQVP